MRTIGKTYYDYMLDADHAFAGRWSYYRPVCVRLSRLPEGKVLEIGPYKMTMVPGCDVMDIVKHGPPVKFLQDACDTPWPIKDKEYDMVVALQVLEHLKGNQQKVFAEIKRIAKRAIISIPYLWERSKSPDHNGIDMEKLHEWTGREKPIWSCTAQPGSRKVVEYAFCSGAD